MRLVSHLLLFLFCGFLLFGLAIGVTAVAQGRATVGTGMPIEYVAFLAIGCFAGYGCWAGGRGVVRSWQGLAPVRGPGRVLLGIGALFALGGVSAMWQNPAHAGMLGLMMLLPAAGLAVWGMALEK